MIPESNTTRSGPHFSWFNPSNYLAVTRNVINPFQGTQNNPEGLATIPIRCMPINETANIVVDPEPTLSNPTKKPKTSKRTSNDGAEPTSKVKQGRPAKAKSDASPSAKKGRKNLHIRR